MNSGFPKCLYCATGNITVHNQEEMDLYLERGYETSHVRLDRIEELKKLIAHHKSEMIILERELEALLKYDIKSDIRTEVIRSPTPQPLKHETEVKQEEVNKDILPPVLPVTGTQDKKTHETKKPDNTRAGKNALAAMGLE